MAAPSSIEDLTGKGPQIEIEMLPIEDVALDPSNPNVMDETLYEAMVQDIRERGFTQPVLVWRTPEGAYRMIDGEHRMRALSDLGATNVPAIVDSASPTEDEARIRLISMNRFRGEFVPIKLAYFLADLAQRIPEKELRRRLAMEETELRDSLRLASFTDDVGDRLREDVAREEREAPAVLSFVVSKRDAAVVDRVIDGLVTAGAAKDRGQALGRVCRHFEKNGGQ